MPRISRDDNAGNNPGSRCASIDLPEPGGPIINMLCLEYRPTEPKVIHANQ